MHYRSYTSYYRRCIIYCRFCIPYEIEMVFLHLLAASDEAARAALTARFDIEL